MASNRQNTTIRRRLVSAWISTVISLSMVLLLVGIGALLLINAKAVSDYFKENLQVSVLLKEQVGEDEARQYESQVAALPGVRSTTFISREQGVEEMANMLGQDFLDVFESAPVPISIDVNLEAEYVSADSLEVVKAQLAKSPLVEEVVYQTSLVDALNQNLQKISLGLAVLVGLLLFISFVLIFLPPILHPHHASGGSHPLFHPGPVHGPGGPPGPVCLAGGHPAAGGRPVHPPEGIRPDV